MNVDCEQDSSDESSENSLEDLKEIESRLYSIIHYNNLSETDPTDLPEGFQIDINKSNEITVSITDYNCLNDILTNKWAGSSQLDTYDCFRSDGNCTATEEEDSVCDEPEKSNERHPMTSPPKVSSSELNCEQTDDDDVQVISPLSVPDSVSRDVNARSGSNNKNYSSYLIVSDTNAKSQNQNIQFSDVIDSSDLITNIGHNMGEKQIEEIIISSDDDPQLGMNNCTPERNKVKTKKKSKKLEKHCPKKWNSSMMKFYSKISRKKLNFDSLKLIKEMRATVGRGGWFLNDKDLHGEMSRRQRRRCPRCRQFDHDIKHCTEPIKPITCHMCGDIGHRESRCPHKKCLTCGRSNEIFVKMCSQCMSEFTKGLRFCCKICNSKYHQEDLCPDVWRGFHMTTKEGTLVIPLSKCRAKKLCCNCARSGHLDYECREMGPTVIKCNNPSVSNYLAVAVLFAPDKENLTIDIRLNAQEGRVLSSEDGYDFLQNLSNTTKARLELVVESPTGSLTVRGTQYQCKEVLDNVNNFVVTNLPNSVSFHHKHKKKNLSKKRKTL